MKIKQVTFTGADDLTKPYHLLQLSAEYPFIEWGILLSVSGMREGRKRYPSLRWMDELTEIFSDRVRLSGHMCGAFVRDIFSKGKILFRDAYPEYWAGFQRIQLNFGGVVVPVNVDLPALFRKIGEYEKDIIFQMDMVNEVLYHAARRENFHRYFPLFDSSCGAGISPEKWRIPFPGVYCGYAGGLGPHNLERELEFIQSVAGPDDEIWIDMETHVRSDADRVFDLDKVVMCCDIVKKFIET